MRTSHLEISTPEHVSLKFSLAGLGSRATAQLIDWSILGLSNLIVFWSIVIPLTERFGLMGSYLIAFVIIFLFLLYWCYFVLFEFFNAGRTPGKMLIGIRVIQDNGQSITFLSALIRNLLRLIDFLPVFYLVGILMVFFHSKHKRIGDLAGGTLVIIEKKRGENKNSIEKEIEKEKITADRITIDEWSKNKMGIKEWNLLKTYLQRRTSLADNQKEEMGMKIASILFPLVNISIEGKEFSEIEKDLYALYLIIREEWEY